MPSLGELLRRERLAKGIDLGQVSEETRVSIRYLEALENDDWSNLPGSLFSRSFARQFARAVGLPEEEVEREIDRLCPADTGEGSMQPERAGSDLPPIPDAVGLQRIPKRKFYGSAIWLLVVVLVCTGAYILWFRSQSDAVDPTPPALPSPVKTGGMQAAPDPTLVLPTVAPPVVPPSVDPPPGGVDAGQAAGAVVVAIVPKATVWVSLTVDGKSVHVGNLRAADAKTVRARKEVRMRTGNAGLTEMTWNGAALGPAGPVGQVRTVVFRADRYEVLPARRRTSGGASATADSDPPSG